MLTYASFTLRGGQSTYKMNLVFAQYTFTDVAHN